MAADPTTLALLREAREMIASSVPGTGARAKLLARIDAHLSGAGVEWREIAPGEWEAKAAGYMLWAIRRSKYEWCVGLDDGEDSFTIADGAEPTEAEAKAAAEKAAGVSTPDPA